MCKYGIVFIEARDMDVTAVMWRHVAGRISEKNKKKCYFYVRDLGSYLQPHCNRFWHIPLRLRFSSETFVSFSQIICSHAPKTAIFIVKAAITLNLTSFLLCLGLSIILLPSGSQTRCYAMLESMYILPMIITLPVTSDGQFHSKHRVFLIYLANVWYNRKLKDERK